MKFNYSEIYYQPAELVLKWVGRGTFQSSMSASGWTQADSPALGNISYHIRP